MGAEQEFEKAVLDAMDEWLDDLADRIFEKSQMRLEQENKIDRGTLIQTANVQRARLHKTIVYPAPHATVVHYGRLPGTYPPVQPLIEWAARHGLDKPESAGYAIQKAIKERGIQPLPFLEEAMLDAIIEVETQ